MRLLAYEFSRSKFDQPGVQIIASARSILESPFSRRAASWAKQIRTKLSADADTDCSNAEPGATPTRACVTKERANSSEFVNPSILRKP